MAVELLTLSPGTGFDPTNPQHVGMVTEKIEPEHGTGWTLQSYDGATGKLTLRRQTAVNQVTRNAADDSFVVDLEYGTKPADGDKVAAQLESDPQHAGYVMVAFEPHLGEATLAKMTKDARRCRGAVANALRVKPWDVQVTDRADGGFEVVLPATYRPSQHDKALDEVATAIIGRPGWYVSVNAKEHTASIIPGELPTFPAMVPYPLGQLARVTTDRTPFGVALGNPGESVPRQLAIDWKGSQFALVAGTAGGGKSATINAIIAGWVSAGGELVIVDIPDKKNDYTWAKPWVRPGGWGCESDLAALATLELLYEEGKRRARINEQYGAAGWRNIPATERYKPILAIIDELSGLVVTEKIPSGVPKDNPVVQRKIMSNLVRVSIDDVIQRMVREQRAMGMHVLQSTQVTNNNTGVGPSVKALIGNIMLQGSSQTRTQRAQAFSAEDRVPQIPSNVAEDPNASVGVGCAELAGQEPSVYKGLFAMPDEYRSALQRLGLPTTANPEPSATDIARFDPTVEEPDLDGPAPRSRPSRGTPRVDGLSGAAAAAHDAAMEQAIFDREQRNRAVAQATAEAAWGASDPPSGGPVA